MRIAIIGLGIMGAMSAWRLAQAGHDVTGYDTYTADHPFGSSHGESRIVRRVYPDPYYTALMADSYALWREFVAAAGDDDLIHLNGGLFFGPQNHPNIIATVAAMRQAAATHEIWDASECARRYCGLRFRGDEIGIYDPEMGYARASNCVTTAWRLASEAGANLTPGQLVEDIRQHRDGTIQVTIDTVSASFDSVILSAGAWMNDLLAMFETRLPLNVTRQIYVNVALMANEHSGQTSVPTWIDGDSYCYGFPPVAGSTGCKLARHVPGSTTSPLTVDRTVTAEDIGPLMDYAAGRVTDATRDVISAGTCLYSNTPDEDFVIDTLPNAPNVVVVSACSGHGFKFAPLIGEIASRLATRQTVVQDIRRFRLARFA